MLAASVRRSSSVLHTPSRLSYIEIWNFARQRRLGRAQPILYSIGKRRNHHDSLNPLQQAQDIESIRAPLERYQNAG
jgi:aspartyl-tRNA synthetase